MAQQSTILVFGGTGQTGRHFVSLALDAGHAVRVLARNPAKLSLDSERLEVRQGAVTDALDLDGLLEGVDHVVSMLGDAELQRTRRVNTELVRALVPAMRRQGVRRLLYQAGGLTKPPDARLPPVQWLIKNTVGRSFIGQHEDNAAVIDYLWRDAPDIEWIVHRAGIGSDGPSKGVLTRSRHRPSIATFGDCAAYNLHALTDDDAVHTWDYSRYRRA